MSGATTNGPFVIAYTLSFIFMGTLVVQAYVYFVTFTDDRKALKALVTIILLLETLITVFSFYGFWASSTSQYMLTLDPGPVVPWLAAVLAVTTGLVATLTHGFYCWRIYILQGSYITSFRIMTMSLNQLAFIIVVGVVEDFFPSVVTSTYVPGSSSIKVSYSVSPWLVMWLGSSALCDLTITFYMILCLRPSKSPFATNKSSLVKLTKFTLETGLITTLTTCLELILGTVFMQYMYHIAVFPMISKLYANCLLASLNFRLVLENNSDSTVVNIVWDDATLDSQSTQSGSRSIHTVHIPPEVESSMNVNNGLNETGPELQHSRKSDVWRRCLILLDALRLMSRKYLTPRADTDVEQ